MRYRLCVTTATLVLLVVGARADEYAVPAWELPPPNTDPFSTPFFQPSNSSEHFPNAPNSALVDAVTTHDPRAVTLPSEVVGARACCCNLTTWATMELLIGRTRGPSVAPIVTTGPVSAGAFAGAIGQPTTLPLFGGKRILDDWRSGLRIELGAWMDSSQQSGIGLRFYSLFTANEQFRSASNNRIVINVPQSVSAGPIAIQIPAFVNFPGASTGRAAASAETMFAGGDVNWRYLIDRNEWGRVDTLVGYRQLHLVDSLGSNFNVVPTSPVSESLLVSPQYAGVDNVHTRNNFYGPQLGLCASAGVGRFWIEGHATGALGVTESSLDFARSRTGVVASNPAAMLATLGAPASATNSVMAATTNQVPTMQSNVASRLSYFGVVGEGGVRVNWRATDHVRFTAGYSFLYWNNVRRAQEMFILGPVLRPQAIDFTTHLFSVGLDLRF